MGCLQGLDFQPVGGDALVGQESFFSRLQPTHVKKSEHVPKAVAIVWGNLFTFIHNACG